MGPVTSFDLLDQDDIVKILMKEKTVLDSCDYIVCIMFLTL